MEATREMVSGVPRRRWEKWMDVVVAISWAIYAGFYLAAVWVSRDFTNVGLFVFYTIVAVLFLRRRPAAKTAPWWQVAVSLADVYIPVFVVHPASQGWEVGNFIQAVALIAMIVSLLSLGASFGIAPADRGLRTQGMYRWIRHPLYASEILFYVGYVVANVSLRNVFGLVLVIALLVIRIHWEEQIIEGYETYASRVRWRLVPGIW